MKRTPRGFILPFVLVTLTVIALLSMTSVGSLWRAHRAVRLSANGQRAQYAAEEALAVGMNTLADSTVFALRVGEVRSSDVQTAAGDTVTLRVLRTHPLALWLQAEARLRHKGVAFDVHRSVSRAVWLDAPALPLAGAITALGSLEGVAGAISSGFDVPLPSDACGPTRDTASVMGVAATNAHTAAASWIGAADWAQLDGSQTLPMLSADILARWRARSATLPSGSSAITPAPQWRALAMVPGNVTLTGASAWRGILLVDGDLTLQHALRVEGVLVVRGRLDARDAPLIVRGAVIIEDAGKVGSIIGAATHVTFDRCALLMALATVSESRFTPFSLWYEPLR